MPSSRLERWDWFFLEHPGMHLYISGNIFRIKWILLSFQAHAHKHTHTYTKYYEVLIHFPNKLGMLIKKKQASDSPYISCNNYSDSYGIPVTLMLRISSKYIMLCSKKSQSVSSQSPQPSPFQWVMYGLEKGVSRYQYQTLN